MIWLEKRLYFQSSVLIPMMSTHGAFKMMETDFYRALALPTQSEGAFIVILPKNDRTLNDVEMTMMTNGVDLDKFIQNLNNDGQVKSLTVKIPRLNIQITHEWSSSAKKTMTIFANSTGETVKGNEVGIYQDTYLELSESPQASSPGPVDEPLVDAITDVADDFNADQPFIFLITQSNYLLALGRVKDPFWCKFCS